jgi:MATE family multidrug resistance protein
MGLVGVVVAAAGPWFMPWFTNAADPQAAQVAAKGCQLLWIAAGYQLFDGFNISSGACLRGAGDVRIPSVMVIALSWSLFVPLAHMLTFKPGEGWVHWLPQFGFGAIGGWFAALIYICCLGVMLYLRWRSGAWRRVVLR